MPANKATLCSVGGHRSRPAARRQREQRVAAALAGRPPCPRPAPTRERRAEGDGAEQRDRHELALGHHAVEVLDPDRHQLDVGPRLGEMIEPALERQQLLVAGVARALRKQDQRAPASSASAMMAIGVGTRGCAGRARSARRWKTRCPMKRAQPAREPVVGGGDRPRRRRRRAGSTVQIRTKSPWLVVGEIDPLPRIGRAAAPVAAHAGDEPREAGDGASRDAASINRDPLGIIAATSTRRPPPTTASTCTNNARTWSRAAALPRRSARRRAPGLVAGIRRRCVQRLRRCRRSRARRARSATPIERVPHRSRRGWRGRPRPGRQARSGSRPASAHGGGPIAQPADQQTDQRRRREKPRQADRRLGPDRAGRAAHASEAFARARSCRSLRRGRDAPRVAPHRRQCGAARRERARWPRSAWPRRGSCSSQVATAAALRE